nr:MAG TPA: hypothetical protein [Caudoviricetes sp.]
MTVHEHVVTAVDAPPAQRQHDEADPAREQAQAPQHRGPGDVAAAAFALAAAHAAAARVGLDVLVRQLIHGQSFQQCGAGLGPHPMLLGVGASRSEYLCAGALWGAGSGLPLPRRLPGSRG